MSDENDDFTASGYSKWYEEEILTDAEAEELLRKLQSGEARPKVKPLRITESDPSILK